MVKSRESETGPLGDYISAFQENLNGPIPLCVGKSEELCGNFLKSIDADNHFSALKLISYSYSAIRSSTALCLAGATPSVPSVLRGSIEASAYALLFQRQPKWARLWRSRHDNKKARDEFRNKSGPALKHQLSKESAQLHGRYKSLYDLLIDFGAHPNVLGVEATIQYSPLSDGRVDVAFQQLTGDFERKLGFVNITQASLILLEVMTSIWLTQATLLQVDEKQQSIINLMHDYAPTLSAKQE